MSFILPGIPVIFETDVISAANTDVYDSTDIPTQHIYNAQTEYGRGKQEPDTEAALQLLSNNGDRINKSIYGMPYSATERNPDWHRLWINTATLSGAFIGTLLVLECLPENATSWNRAELQDVPLFKRWHNHVIKKGPEWDHDKFYFNYILHPYAGAVYYMGARSCGFNVWQSLLYCTCISTIGWEFGVEGFMERPSLQDIFITPIAGSLIGEFFFKVKRKIVSNGYSLGGSSVLGNLVVFLVDPVNEFIGIFAGNPCRKQANVTVQTNLTSSLLFSTNGNVNFGLSLQYTF